MSDVEPLNAQHRALVEALSRALDAGDAAAFRVSFEQLRESMHAQLLPDLMRVTTTAQNALKRFRKETRLDELAANQVPDARKRLTHVVKLTDEAAHHTLDLIERAVPLVEQTAREATALLAAWSADEHCEAREESSWPQQAHAFLERAAKDAEQLRAHLSGMLLAQGYQDITGQIIRGVIALVGELETVLNELMLIAVGDETLRIRALTEASRDTQRRDMGPLVPGVNEHGALSDQDAIDALLNRVTGGS